MLQPFPDVVIQQQHCSKNCQIALETPPMEVFEIWNCVKNVK